MVGVQSFEAMLSTHSELYADINNGLKEFSDFDFIQARCIGGGVSLYRGISSLIQLLINVKLSSLDKEFHGNDARICSLLETWRVDSVDGWRYGTLC
jgi:hypothetical protein